MKRVYLFYLTDPELSNMKYPAVLDKNIITNKTNRYALYAWTTRKNIKNMFKNHRNMKIFHCSKQYMEIDEYKIFSDKYSNLMLENRRLSTKNFVESENRYNTESICILSPASEIEFITNSGLEVISEISQKIYTSLPKKTPMMFKKDYRRAFKILSFSAIFNGSRAPQELDLPWSMNSVSIDWVNVYCHVFKNTYNIGGKYENL